LGTNKELAPGAGGKKGGKAKGEDRKKHNVCGQTG